MKKRMDKYLDLTENVLAMIDCFLLLFATFSIGAQVISRYFFNHPFMWVDEIN